MEEKRLLGSYKNGDYNVYIWSDGTKIREAPNNVFNPGRPECIDMGISTKCNHGCEYCYMGCTMNGQWADFSKYDYLNNMPKLLELNINLNFPLNPDIVPFLERMKAQHVIVNGTVNQDHFMSHLPLIRNFVDNELIHGLGISYVTGGKTFIRKVKEFPNAVVHVIAGYVGKDEIEELADNGIKLLVLGYKKLGRGIKYYEEWDIEHATECLAEFLPSIRQRFELIAFDNLALKQLHVKDWVDPKIWEENYLGPDAMTSFYIDLVNGYYAPNSLSDDHRPIGEKTVQQMFDDIRGSIKDEI